MLLLKGKASTGILGFSNVKAVVEELMVGLVTLWADFILDGFTKDRVLTDSGHEELLSNLRRDDVAGVAASIDSIKLLLEVIQGFGQALGVPAIKDVLEQAGEQGSCVYRVPWILLVASSARAMSSCCALPPLIPLPK
jgi:hypothetical protein